jgi:hypothetical protein
MFIQQIPSAPENPHTHTQPQQKGFNPLYPKPLKPHNQRNPLEKPLKSLKTTSKL